MKQTPSQTLPATSDEGQGQAIAGITELKVELTIPWRSLKQSRRELASQPEPRLALFESSVPPEILSEGKLPGEQLAPEDLNLRSPLRSSDLAKSLSATSSCPSAARRIVPASDSGECWSAYGQDSRPPRPPPRTSPPQKLRARSQASTSGPPGASPGSTRSCRELRRQLSSAGFQRLGAAIEDRAQELKLRLAFERESAREHLVEGGPESEDVAATTFAPTLTSPCEAPARREFRRADQPLRRRAAPRPRRRPLPSRNRR